MSEIKNLFRLKLGNRYGSLKLKLRQYLESWNPQLQHIKKESVKSLKIWLQEQ